MDNADIIGSIAPLTDEDNNRYGLELSGDYIKLSGLVITTVHPSRISIASGNIDLTYTVGDKEKTRSYALERSDGKIVAFTNPDGTRTEVLHNG